MIRQSKEIEPQSRDARWVGASLVSATLLSILLMAHHPTTHGNDADALTMTVALGALSKAVHGGLILMLMVEACALIELSRRLRFERLWVIAALVAYLAGISATIGAALIGGFVIPNLALYFSQVAPAGAQQFRELATLAMLGNQALANFGVAATSTAITFWSLVMSRGPKAHRTLGGLGVVVGTVCLAALTSGLIRLNVPGMTAIVLAQAVWNIAIGTALFRGKISPLVRPAGVEF